MSQSLALPQSGRSAREWAPRAILVLTALLVTDSPAHAQQQSQRDVLQQINSLGWQSYPSVGIIGDVAQIRLADGIRFLDAKNSSRFLELTGNLPSNTTYTIAPPT